MSRTHNVEEFRPHYEPITLSGIKEALADLNPADTLLGATIALPYTRREDGTVDTIEIGEYQPGTDWMVYTSRAYGGCFSTNITSTVGKCPGHMVILVVRALYTYLTAIGPRGRAETVEGDILYALGLAREPIFDEGHALSTSLPAVDTDALVRQARKD